MEEKIFETEELNEGFTLIELLETLKTNLLLLLVICIGFVAAGVFYTKYVVTPMYTSSIDLRIHIAHEQTSGTDASKAATAIQVANNIREYVKMQEVVSAVILSENLNVSSSNIARRISTTNLGSAAAVKISFQDANPERASEIVIALAEELARRMNLPSSDAESLKFATEEIKPINYPKINAFQAPSSPNTTLNIIISFLLGAIVGVVIVILRQQFSNKFASKKEVENFLKLPVLAIIPSRERSDFNG